MKKFLAIYLGSDSGDMLKQWESLSEEATKIFLNHPHYTIFPGDSIEVMECLPLPTA